MRQLGKESNAIEIANMLKISKDDDLIAFVKVYLDTIDTLIEMATELNTYRIATGLDPHEIYIKLKEKQ